MGTKGRQPPNTSEEFLKLKAYVEAQHDGTMLYYNNISLETGVPMSAARDRARLQRAIVAAGRPAKVIRNEGYWLCDPKTAHDPVAERVARIRGAMGATLKVIDRVETRFNEQLDSEQTMFISMVKTTTLMIRGEFDEKTREVLAKKMQRALKSADSKIEIPDMP